MRTVHLMVATVVVAACWGCAPTPSTNATPEIEAAPMLSSSVVVLEAQEHAPRRKGPGAGTVSRFIGGGALTGVLIIERLRAALHGILDHVRNIATDVTTRLEQGLEATLAHLGQILGEHVAKPINELTGTMRLAVDRALAVLERAQSTLLALTTCIGVDAVMVARTLDVAMTSNVRDVAFWTSNRPFVAFGHVSGEGSRMGLYAGKAPATYKLRGVYPGLDTACDTPLVWLVDERNHWQSVRVAAADIREIAVEIPTLTAPGLRRVEIRYKDRNRRRCARDWQVVQSSVAVAVEPTYQVDYTAQATCSVQRSQEIVEWLRVTNDRCNGDRSTSVQICPPVGTSYLSHHWATTSSTRCSSSTSMVGGDCVRHEATCPGRGGILCTGPRSWHHGRLHLNVARMEDVPASTPFTGRFVDGVLVSTTRTMTIVDPHSFPVGGGSRATACEWTVSASITHPSGRRTDIPSRTGRGPLASSADGISLEWNPNDGGLSVSTPEQACEYF